MSSSSPVARFVVAACAAAVVWGCSDDPSPTPSSTVAKQHAAFCADVAKERCSARKACCKTTSDACAEALTKECVGAESGLAAADAESTTAIDPTSATACITALKKHGTLCQPVPPDESSTTCGAVVRDKAPLGGICLAKVAGRACGDGTARCMDTGKGIHCQAVTTKKPEPGTAKAGEKCAKVGDCVPGLACDETKWQCVPRVDKDAACLAHRHCKEGLLCDGLALKGTCEATSSIGKACSQHQDCAAGLHCDEKVGSCQPEAGGGGSCSNSKGCSELLYCDIDAKTCKPLPGEGQPCAYNVRTCLPGLTCYQPTKKDRTCVKPRKKGQKCSQHNNCVAGLGCDFGKGVCVDLPANGKPCFDGVYCKEGWCDHKAGSCRAWLKSGASCKDNIQCGRSAVCVGNSRQTLKCTKLPQKGEACLVGCASGLFCALKKLPGTCKPAICAL